MPSLPEGQAAKILDEVPEAILLVASDGSIVFASSRCEAIFGYGSDELVGIPVDVLVPDRFRLRHFEHQQTYAASPRVRPMGLGLRLRALRKDGGEIPVDIALSPLPLDGERLTICSVRDVTERTAIEERLRESDIRLQLAVATGRMLAWDRDLETDVVHISGEHARWLLGDVAGGIELPFGEFRALVHVDDRDAFDLGVASRLQGRDGEYEFRVRAADDTYHWVTSRGSVVRDERGEAVRIVGVWVDTSAHKKAELALAARARQAAAVVELGQLALGGTPAEWLMEAAVETIARTLEVPYAKVLEFQPADGTLVLRAGVGWHEGLVGTATVPGGKASQGGFTLLSSGPVIVRDFASETRFTAPPLLVEHGVVSGISVVIPGAVYPIGVLGAHTTEPRDFDENDVAFVQAVAHVLSEGVQRAVAEADVQRTLELLRKTDEERRRLLRYLVQAEEKERRRIATDIHDDSIQVMSALALRLDLIRDHVEDAELREMVDDVAETVGATLTRLRQLIFELVPPALHQEGLAPALRLHLERLRSEYGLDYDLEDDLAAEPDTEARGILFRISLEALTNIVKHARATRVTVLMRTTEEGACVRIADDGRGFVPSPRGDSPPGHIGLSSMRERAELVGGRFVLVSTPEVGTTVEFTVPDSSADVENAVA